MKNRKTVKILLALCLTLIVGVFAGIAAFANTSDTDDGLKIAYKNIDLDSTVRIAFAIEKDAVDAYDSIKLVVTDEETGDPIALEYVRDASGALTEDLFVNTYEINGVDYYAYFTVGFAPKDFDTVVNAYAVGVKNGEEVAAGPSLRYSVIEYLLRQQDKNLDATRQELYASFLEYHEYAAKVLGTYTPTYLVKVNDGTKTVTRTYKAGETVAVTADTSAIVAGSAEAGFNIGWVDSQGKIVALGADAEFAASSTGTVSPCYVAPTKNVKTESDTFILKVAKDDKNLGSAEDGFAVYAWSELVDGDSEKYNNLRAVVDDGKGNSIDPYSNHGSWSYSEAINALVMNSKDRESKGNGFTHVSLTNPNAGATDGSNVSVLEFDVTIPSRDYDGDGVYNEANGDFFYKGDVGTAIANIQVGFENNNFALYQATERLFTLTIYANTDNDGNKVACWALGSTGDIADANNPANVFNSQTNVTKYKYYNLDETYTIKLVYVPGTYSSEDRNVTNDTKTIGKIDIYVNGEYHHSRGFVSSSSVATGKTSDYEDKELGMANNAVNDAATPNRFNNSQRIGVALGSSGGSLGGEYYSNFVAYSMPAYALERTGVHGGTYEVYGISYLTTAEMREYLARTVTVIDGSYTYGEASGLTTGKVYNCDTITLTAPATKDGKNFSYWANESGARIYGSKLSSNIMTVTVTADATYKPVYGAAAIITSTTTINCSDGRISGFVVNGHVVRKSAVANAELIGYNGTTVTKPNSNGIAIDTELAKQIVVSWDYTLVAEDIGTPNENLAIKQDDDVYYIVDKKPNGISAEFIGDIFGTDTKNFGTARGSIQMGDGTNFYTISRVDYLVVDSDKDNIADGYTIRLSASDTSSTYVNFGKVFALDEVVSLSFAINVDENANVTGIDVYANGELLGTTGTKPLATTNWGGTHIRVQHEKQNRFIGTLKLDNGSAIVTEYYEQASSTTSWNYDDDVAPLYNANSIVSFVNEDDKSVLKVEKSDNGTGSAYLVWGVNDLPYLNDGYQEFVFTTKVKLASLETSYNGWLFNGGITDETNNSNDVNRLGPNGDVSKAGAVTLGSKTIEEGVWYTVEYKYTYDKLLAKYILTISIDGEVVATQVSGIKSDFTNNVKGFGIKTKSVNNFDTFDVYFDDTTFTVKTVSAE